MTQAEELVAFVEGAKTVVRTKEEADHSLPYLVAVALLDGEVMPQQYQPERLQRPDVQGLLRRVVVRPRAAFTARFPEEMPCLLTVFLRDGRVLVREKSDYEGFSTTPMRWETVTKKFADLSGPYAEGSLQQELGAAVQDLENRAVAELMRVIAKVQTPAA
jgi:2-methylcitrate dehydratase